MLVIDLVYAQGEWLRSAGPRSIGFMLLVQGREEEAYLL